MILLVQFVDVHKYILLFLNAGVGANVDWLFWASQLHTLPFPLHAAQLGLLQIREIHPHILGVDEWPRIVVSMPDCFYPSVLRWVPYCHVYIPYRLLNAGELVHIVDVLLFVDTTQQGSNVFLAMLGSMHGVQLVLTPELSWVIQ